MTRVPVLRDGRNKIMSRTVTPTRTGAAYGKLWPEPLLLQKMLQESRKTTVRVSIPGRQPWEQWQDSVHQHRQKRQTQQPWHQSIKESTLDTILTLMGYQSLLTRDIRLGLG